MVKEKDVKAFEKSRAKSLAKMMNVKVNNNKRDQMLFHY